MPRSARSVGDVDSWIDRAWRSSVKSTLGAQMRRPKSLVLFLPVLLAGAVLLPGAAGPDPRGTPRDEPIEPVVENGGSLVEDLAPAGDEIQGEIAVDLKDSATDEEIAGFSRTYGLAL